MEPIPTRQDVEDIVTEIELKVSDIFPKLQLQELLCMPAAERDYIMEVATRNKSCNYPDLDPGNTEDENEVIIRKAVYEWATNFNHDLDLTAALLHVAAILEG